MDRPDLPGVGLDRPAATSRCAATTRRVAARRALAGVPLAPGFPSRPATTTPPRHTTPPPGRAGGRTANENIPPSVDGVADDHAEVPLSHLQVRAGTDGKTWTA